jgi:hypothetical protein
LAWLRREMLRSFRLKGSTIIYSDSHHESLLAWLSDPQAGKWTVSRRHYDFYHLPCWSWIFNKWLQVESCTGECESFRLASGISIERLPVCPCPLLDWLWYMGQSRNW